MFSTLASVLACSLVIKSAIYSRFCVMTGSAFRMFGVFVATFWFCFCFYIRVDLFHAIGKADSYQRIMRDSVTWLAREPYSVFHTCIITKVVITIIRYHSIRSKYDCFGACIIHHICPQKRFQYIAVNIVVRDYLAALHGWHTQCIFSS